MTLRLCLYFLATLLLNAACAAPATHSTAYLERLPQDEIVYFVLPDRFENGDVSNDRGGFSGDRLVTGFDPSAKGFFHGGDLRGLLNRLDYIQSLGATAIWLGPIYANKPVQGPPGEESAGYHGYWITDFTRVDAHFGSNADMAALVAAIHQRGMKIYLDIITNHTADVIAYRGCSECAYRSRADFPYSRSGGIGGEAINAGFAGTLGSENQNAANFARLTRPDYAYAPIVPAGEAHVKVPDWLNDPIYYHNRGNSTFTGESSDMGDFVGLDDLMTEQPRVVQGFIEIYGDWIERYRLDGFRIDTAKHVNPEFWQAFVPAMRARAAAVGTPNFHIFGEVATTDVDLPLLPGYSRLAKLPAVLDFNFNAAVRETVAGNAGTDLLARLFAADVLYEHGAATAMQLPTFIGNHDLGRFAFFVRHGFPKAGDDEVLKRVVLGHAMLLTLRGVPTLFYGDEQGFAGLGVDQAARQDMFASRVESYNNDSLVGTSLRTTTSSFDRPHPIRSAITVLTALRLAQPALRRGLQTVRISSSRPGLFVVSRFDPDDGREVVIAFNTSTEPQSAQVEVNHGSQRFRSLHGGCEPLVSAPGSYHVMLAALDYAICGAQ
jgi:glycosidase